MSIKILFALAALALLASVGTASAKPGKCATDLDCHDSLKPTCNEQGYCACGDTVKSVGHCSSADALKCRVKEFSDGCMESCQLCGCSDKKPADQCKQLAKGNGCKEVAQTKWDCMESCGFCGKKKPGPKKIEG